MTKLIDPINSAGMRGALKQATEEHKSMIPSDGQIYAAVSRRDALRQVLDFLESIEGAGYGGMAEFEIARMTMRDEVHGIFPKLGLDYSDQDDPRTNPFPV